MKSVIIINIIINIIIIIIIILDFSVIILSKANKVVASQTVSGGDFWRVHKVTLWSLFAVYSLVLLGVRG